MKNTIEIIIREDTSRKLRLDKDSNFLRAMKSAVADFLRYDFLNATSALFELLYEDNKYTHNKVLKKLNFTLYAEDSFKYSCFFIEEESVLPIAEELYFQYMAAHPNFLKVKNCPNCEEALEDLKSVMANHPILLYKAADSVWNTHKNAELVKSCVSLLYSEKESSKAKGLEKMSHSPKLQKLLLPYAKEIGQFLQAMHSAYMDKQQLTMEVKEKEESANNSHKKQLISAAQAELNASPFAVLATIRDKLPAEAKPTPKVETKVGASSAPNVATTSEVTSVSNATSSDEQCSNTPSLIKYYSVSQELSKFLDNKDALTFSIPNAAEFWEQMAQLRNIGIDLNLLVDNLQYVLAVLSAHEHLDESTSGLLKADKDYKVAIANFSPDDMETLHALSAAGKALMNAKFIYTSAYDSFVEHRDAFENAVKA